jgi:hypothetical protein
MSAIHDVVDGVEGRPPRISEAYLKPVLEDMMRQFPFRTLGFHTDNGSEFIHRTVAELLNKLLIEQTKSRPRQSGDNGLVETKNGAVIRKHIGYGYIHASHADPINDFDREYLNPYLNYHRPCAQAEVEIDERGCKRVRYKRYQTPLETLLALEKPAQYLRQGLSINALKRIAAASATPTRRGPCNRPKASCSNSCGSPRSTEGWMQRAEEMAVSGTPAQRRCRSARLQ